MFKYYIRYPEPIDANQINLIDEQFLSLQRHQSILLHAIYFEEKYEIVIQNYIDLEKAVHNISLNQKIFNLNIYERNFTDTILLNTKLSNLLGSTKPYIDQSKTHIKKCIPEIDDSSIEKLFKHEYDNNFHYRFMKTLRNHAQHYQLCSVDSISEKSMSHEIENRIEHSTQAFITKESLKKNKAFKNKILDEIDEKVSLLESSRSYIQSISKIHIELRNILNPHTEHSRLVISEEMQKHKHHFSFNIPGIDIFKIQDRKVIDKICLITAWDDERIKLANKNTQLHRLVDTYIKNAK